MIFYKSPSDRPLTKEEVSGQLYLAKWYQIEPKSHTELSEILSHQDCCGCSLGNVNSSLNLKPEKITTQSKAKKNEFTRTKNIISQQTNAFLFDIEVSSALEDFIEPPLNSLEKVEDFIKSCGLKSYIIGKSNSAIEKGHTNKWHVYALFDKVISVVAAKNFVSFKVPKDSWQLGLTSHGKEVVKNSYLDTSVFDISRVVYENTKVTFKVVDNGFNNADLINNYASKPFNLSPFESLKPSFSNEEQERRQEIYKKSKTDEEHSAIEKGYLTPSTMLMTSTGEFITVSEIIENNKSMRLTSLIDDTPNQHLAYYPDSKQFKDYHDNGKMYRVLHSNLPETLTFDSDYLPDLDLSNDNTFILAPTGSGKTHYFKYKFNKMVIFAVPTKSIVKDQSGHESGKATFKDFHSDQLNTMTFDKLAGHISHGHDLSKYHIVIDEVHKLFTSESSETRRLLYSSILLRQIPFKKLICLSATFDSTLLPTKDLKSFIYKSTRDPVHISFYKNAPPLEALIKGRTLVFMQSKIKNAAIKDTFSDKLKVLTLESGSEIPKGDEFDQYDLIVTTSVLREGFSITSKIDTVILYNISQSFGAADIIQSIARPRGSNPEIKVIAASSHFETSQRLQPVSMSQLTTLAIDQTVEYSVEEMKIIKSISIDRLKRVATTIETRDGEDVLAVNPLGLVSFYLDHIATLEKKSLKNMTEGLQSFLPCTVSLEKLSDEETVLPDITVKEITKRLRSCDTFVELSKIISILSKKEETPTQFASLLTSIKDTIDHIQTAEGIKYLEESQQVQYKVKQSFRDTLKKEVAVVGSGVRDLIKKNRAWRENKDKMFTKSAIKRLLKNIIDKNRKNSYSDKELVDQLSHIFRFERLKDNKVIKRGDFTHVRITHLTLVDLSATRPQKDIKIADI